MHPHEYLMSNGFKTAYSHMYFQTEDNLSRQREDYLRMVEFGMVPKPSRIIVTDADTNGGVKHDTKRYLVRVKRHTLETAGDNHPIYSFETDDVRDILAMAVGEYAIAEAQMDGLDISKGELELFKGRFEHPVHHPFSLPYELDTKTEAVWRSGEKGTPPYQFSSSDTVRTAAGVTAFLNLPAQIHGETYNEWLEEMFPELSPSEIPTP